VGILDELSSSTGDKNSNKELVKQCLKMPALLHSIAEGLRTGMPKARQDCAEILTAVAERRADLLGDFVADFLDASRSSNKAIAKLAFTGLAHVIHARPAEVYAERDYLLEVAKQSSAASIPAAGVLAALCGNNPNYRGKLLGGVLRLLSSVPEKDLLKWVTALSPGVAGSIDSIKRFVQAVEPRRAGLDEAASKKLDKLLLKLERTANKPSAK
jgi:hypothetical protein